MTCNIPLTHCTAGLFLNGEEGGGYPACGLRVGRARASSAPRVMVGVGSACDHHLSPRCAGERLRSITSEDLGQARAVALPPQRYLSSLMLWWTRCPE